MLNETIAKIFEIDNNTSFEKVAMAVFRYQYQHNEVYKQWCNLIVTDIKSIHHSTQIPFLPISFFKTHTVTSGSFTPAIVFESSKTTGMQSSQHFVKDIAVYEQSFMKTFEMFYGNIANWCVLGLLPSYLERSNSSLVYMVQKLIEQSQHKQSGFYLNEFDKLYQVLQQLEENKQPTLLIGVTFALLDFAQQYQLPLQHTTVIETGGMKGRREELTRNEVHNILQQAFQCKNIHSEYGMTELLSQAYAIQEGKFICPSWMKAFVRNEDDPLQVQPYGKGVLNIIDLANIHSCSFIATDDVATIHHNNSFEVHGRMDNSDIRGCSLMVV
ncbi:MAG: acyl transferase [Chitinophagales bacterium]|nr:acyl transferase [Chitinophagales bacterium]